MRIPLLVLLSACAALTACSSPQDAAAGRVARSFAVEVVSHPDRACALLAPPALQQLTKDGPCAQALSQTDPHEPGAFRDVLVSGRSAIAHFAADTYFLAQYRDGWRITAAVCTPPDGPDRPYDCEVSSD